MTEAGPFWLGDGLLDLGQQLADLVLALAELRLQTPQEFVLLALRVQEIVVGQLGVLLLELALQLVLFAFEYQFVHLETPCVRDRKENQILEWRRRHPSTSHQCDNKQDHEHQEEKPSDIGRYSHDATEAEHTGNDGHDQKQDGPSKHEDTSSQKGDDRIRSNEAGPESPVWASHCSRERDRSLHSKYGSWRRVLLRTLRGTVL